MKEVSVLSGGERARLTLSKLILSHMNLLVLDEPTNHLDIDSREALESALEEYDGTIFAVSHDRYFVEKLATRIIELCPHPCFGGDLLDFSIGHVGEGYSEFDRYRTARIAERTTTPSAAATVSVEVTASKEAYLKNKQNAAEERKRKNRLEKLKKQCEAMETELSEIDEQLSGEAAYDYVLVAKLDARKTELEDALLAAYEEIEELEV
jgi:ATP-binding cassette subfamily F protein 3